MKFADKNFVYDYKYTEEEIPQKSVMSCPLCKNNSIEIVGRCVTCKVCGWSICNA